MQVRPDNPLIVQGDGKILLEAKHKKYEEVRDFLSRFSELESSPELLHTYKVTPLSLWNAAASGVQPEEIIDTLQGYSKFAVPKEVIDDIDDLLSRYGLVQLIPHPKRPKTKIRLKFATAYVAKLVTEDPRLRSTVKADTNRHWCIDKGHRGLFKQRALLSRWPIEDLAGFIDGDPLEINLSPVRRSSGVPFAPREYQIEAAERWFQKGKPSGGCGVVVLACGAGKTIVGIKAMALVKRKTLILATNQASVNQWIREILDKTDLDESMVGGYTGQNKEVRPVTVATYQILTWRRSRNDDFEHLHVFDDEDWGLVIYDEVHLLPAPVFGATASLQGRRRLGLTATLIREDGREGDVFSLVGPKRYELPWQRLQKQGFIAETACYEVRIAFPPKSAEEYEQANAQKKFRIACSNPAKLNVVRNLVAKHKDDYVLIIGTYVEQLKVIAKQLNAPLIIGATPQKKREILFENFRKGRNRVLVVSKVANFSIDLPDANIAIQVSGTFGSRQEEAQRLGRILRPKKTEARFYSIVTKDSKEQEFALNRQMFLTEQGYRYHIKTDDTYLV
jgi:DNA excision repair protein ERCC-3